MKGPVINLNIKTNGLSQCLVKCIAKILKSILMEIHLVKLNCIYLIGISAKLLLPVKFTIDINWIGIRAALLLPTKLTSIGISANMS